MITKQGFILQNNPIIYQTIPGSTVNILNLRFTCPNNYSLKISKSSVDTNSEILLYSLQLDGGDTVTDSFEYILKPGEYIKAIVDRSNVSYILTGKQL